MHRCKQPLGSLPDGIQREWSNKMSDNRINKIAYTGLLSAFAIIISYVEMLLPLNIGIPGVKPGLANFIILIVLYEFGVKEAFIINFIRILVNGILFANVFSILFSLSGALISMITMFLVKKVKGISMIGVSIAGGVSHNIGQILIASVIVETYSVVYYIPVLILSGVITGILVGVLALKIKPVIHKIVKGDKL